MDQKQAETQRQELQNQLQQRQQAADYDFQQRDAQNREISKIYDENRAKNLIQLI